MNTPIDPKKDTVHTQDDRIGTAGLALALSCWVIPGSLWSALAGSSSSSASTNTLFCMLLFLILIVNLWLLGLIFSIIGLRIKPTGRAKAGLIISLLPLLMWVVALIYSQISTPIRFEEEAKERKAQVIERIKDIRTAQRAYKTKHRSFAPNFDILETFILTDSLELGYKVAVIDTIFAPKIVSIQDIKDLRYIPCSNNRTQFIMETGSINIYSKKVPVIEVRAPYKLFLDTIKYKQEIINLIDDEVNNFNRYPGVKFGSIESANNEAGNWE